VLPYPCFDRSCTGSIFTENPKYKVFIDLLKVSRYRPVSPIANIMWDELDKATQYARLK
jgi:hypothetical protein